MPTHEMKLRTVPKVPLYSALLHKDYIEMTTVTETIGHPRRGLVTRTDSDVLDAHRAVLFFFATAAVSSLAFNTPPTPTYGCAVARHTLSGVLCRNVAGGKRKVVLFVLSCCFQLLFILSR